MLLAFSECRKFIEKKRNNAKHFRLSLQLRLQMPCFILLEGKKDTKMHGNRISIDINGIFSFSRLFVVVKLLHKVRLFFSSDCFAIVGNWIDWVTLKSVRFAFSLHFLISIQFYNKMNHSNGIYLKFMHQNVILSENLSAWLLKANKFQFEFQLKNKIHRFSTSKRLLQIFSSFSSNEIVVYMWWMRRMFRFYLKFNYSLYFVLRHVLCTVCCALKSWIRKNTDDFCWKLNVYRFKWHRK